MSTTFGLCMVLVLAVLGLEVVQGKSHFGVSDQTASKKTKWIVYHHRDFAENELCEVLNCRHHEVCLVRSNNAMCVNRKKLSEVEGHKINFRSSKESHPYRSQDEKQSVWDPARYQEKLAHHNKKMARTEKKHNKPSPNDYWKPKTLDYAKEKQTHQQQSRHMTEKVEDEQDCTEGELKQMGGRLLQWFSDVRSVEKGSNVAALPRHHVACHQDVSWMFMQWDRDGDGELSSEELYPLEHDKYESCVKPFIDHCDVDADDAVTLDEWCDCFLWVGHEREEPPCHSALRRRDPHLLGIFKPRCDVDGFYKAEQCHETDCWCVDRWGREFDQSRTSIGRKPDCGQYAEAESEDLVDGQTTRDFVE